jgi:hemerythrin-like domain-containing protein
MNPLEILMREHEIIRKELTELEEMTFSVSVNTRDFSFLFKKFFEIWDSHEWKEEKLLRVFSEEGVKIPVEQLSFEHGALREYKEMIMEAINSGDEEQIKTLLGGACGELIDLLKAHIMAEEDIFANIPFNELSKETIEKIELLQILPDDRILRE